jgi:hypothetical protein
MYEQALRLNYTSPASVTGVVAIELARKLAELTPGDLSAFEPDQRGPARRRRSAFVRWCRWRAQHADG